MAKVNQHLYLQLKAAVQSGDYTVSEAIDALDWLRVELTRKRSQVLDGIKVSEVGARNDWYDDMHHRRKDAPQSGT